jgi:hypothetical protein
VYVHHLPQLLAQLGLGERALLQPRGAHIALSAALLALPGGVALAAHAAGLAADSALAGLGAQQPPPACMQAVSTIPQSPAFP